MDFGFEKEYNYVVTLLINFKTMAIVTGYCYVNFQREFTVISLPFF